MEEFEVLGVDLYEEGLDSMVTKNPKRIKVLVGNKRGMFSIDMYNLLFVDDDEVLEGECANHAHKVGYAYPTLLKPKEKMHCGMLLNEGDNISEVITFKCDNDAIIFRNGDEDDDGVKKVNLDFFKEVD